MSSSDLPTIDALLREHGLAGVREEPFPNDGWSGASMTLLRRGGGDRFVLKRDSLARDWIARATGDGPVLREARFATLAPMLNPISDIVRAPYLGVARDGDAFAILMPDLSGVLFDWSAPIRIDQLDRVLEGLAVLHAEPFEEAQLDGASCPIRERVTLICRSSLERPGPQRDAVAERLLPGWDAFDREASAAARDVVDRLDADPTPLVHALEGRERRLIHGDLKLANAGVAADGRLDIVDWQMVSVGPIAIELGWFLVANVASLPLPPPEVFDRYARWLDRGSLDPDDGWIRPDFELERDDVDLAILVGLLLRGWRKGYDAEAGITLASGVTARDDLAWWCDRAVEAAARVL